VPPTASLPTSHEVPMPEYDEEEMVDYEPSLVWESMDVSVIYLSSLDYSLVGDDEVSQMDFGSKDTTFSEPKDLDNHLKLHSSRGILMAHKFP
jgi:hypothetical protein